MSEKYTPRGNYTYEPLTRYEKFTLGVLGLALSASAGYATGTWQKPSTVPDADLVKAAASQGGDRSDYLVQNNEKPASKLKVHIIHFVDPELAYPQKITTKASSLIVKAGTEIKHSTYGKYELEMAGETIHTERPQGIRGQAHDEHVCYTDSEMENYDEVYAEQHHLKQDSAIVNLATNTNMCGDYSGLYTGSTSTGTTRIMIDNDDMYDRTTVIEHEFGHAWGLNHAAEISCAKEVDSLTPGGSLNIEYPSDKQISFYEISDLTQRCGIIKNYKSTTTDEYRSQNTVMGDVWDVWNGVVYSPSELNELDPVDYPMKLVSAKPGTYMLSGEKGGLHGIKIALPDDHPLHRTDKTLQYITFGLVANQIQYNAQEFISSDTIQVVATGKGLSYDVDAVSQPYISSKNTIMDMKQQGYFRIKTKLNATSKQLLEPIIYFDKTLGIAVTEGRSEKTGDVYVRVRDIHDPVAKKKIDFYTRYIDAKNAMIASAKKTPPKGPLTRNSTK